MTKRNLLFHFTGIVALSAGCALSFSGSFRVHTIHFISNILNRPIDLKFWGIGLEHAGLELILLGTILFAFALFYDRFPKSTLLLGIATIILSFLIFAVLNTTNIPYHDDYFFLEFLNSYYDNHDLSAIFDMGNESRLILMRGMAVLLYHLGDFNFKTLIFFSIACILGSCYLLFRESKLMDYTRLILGLLLAVIIFQFEYYDSQVWVSGAMYSSCTFFFLIASIFLITSTLKYKFFYALGTCLLCVASNGAGFLSFGVCGLLLLQQKKRLEVIIWGSITLMLVALYLINYSLVHDNFDGVGTEPESLIQRITNCLIFSPVFLGSSIQFMYQLYLPFILGAFIWISFIYFTLKKMYLHRPRIYYVFLCLVLVSFMPPALRNNLPLVDAISVRYGLYSVLAITCCLILWAEKMESKNLKTLFSFLFPVAIVFHLLTGVFFYPEVVLRVEQGKNMARNFKKTNSAVLPAPYKPGPANATFLLNACSEKGIYQLPQE